jgi:putative acetyltransferase
MQANNIIIRPESTTEFAAIADVVTRAFGRPGVAELVRLIRASENYVPALSLVAEQNGQVVGYVMLSHTSLTDNGRLHRVLMLSPLAVDPSIHNQGVGSQLVREAVRLADEQGELVILLEGSPAYYPRFGFRPSVELGIKFKLPDSKPPEGAMALPLAMYDPASAPKGKVIKPEYFKVAEH